ncbi:MAG: DUF4277 domain-containing protein [Deltaproteobacteria bacterium]|nr:DUF4277 domain-containing protein [Deltaproteobacteria bacterium]
MYLKIKKIRHCFFKADKWKIVNCIWISATNVPAPTSCLAEHAESLCIITANIICDNKPLYKVQEWLAKYADGLTNESVNADKFNDDRLGRSLCALFKADRHSLMTEASCNAIKLHKLLTDEIHNDSTTVTFKTSGTSYSPFVKWSFWDVHKFIKNPQKQINKKIQCQILISD